MRLSLLPTTRGGRIGAVASAAVLLLLWLLFGFLQNKYPDSDLFTGGYLVQLLFNGVVLGCVYALISLGYTMVYGVIQLINFAHGDIYMLGAYFGYYFLRIFIHRLYFEREWPLYAAFFLAMFCAMALCALCGVLMEKFAYLPLRKSTRIAALITAVGMSFFLENLGIIVFTANPKSFAPKSFAVYTAEFDKSADFSTPIRRIVYDATRAEAELQGACFARVRVETELGKSDWSQPVALAEGEEFAAGGFEEQSGSKLEAPTGLTINRKPGKTTGSVELKWAETPARIRNIRSVFGSNAVYIPLDFGLRTNPANAASSDYDAAEKRGFGLSATPIQLVILATTAAILAFLFWLINRTKFGIAMRAISFDKDVTRLMGIDTDSVISKTFALGSALAAVAGCLVGLYWESITPLMGILPGIKAFVAAVLGGIGSIPGAAAGGLIMGVSEFLVKGYIPANLSALSDAVAFAFLIIVLLVKPTGLFGRSAKEKV
ncbi:MAG: branched-chain amino acid ABC transporter permease [bacterium]